MMFFHLNNEHSACHGSLITTFYKYRYIDGWMDGWMDGQIDSQIGRQIDWQIDRQMDVCMYGWMDGQIDIDRQIDRQIDVYIIYIYMYSFMFLCSLQRFKALSSSSNAIRCLPPHHETTPARQNLRQLWAWTALPTQKPWALRCCRVDDRQRSETSHEPVWSGGWAMGNPINSLGRNGNNK